MAHRIASVFCFIAPLLVACTIVNSAVTRRAPNINGVLDGDLYQLTGESVNVNSGGRIKGTWFVPGTPHLVSHGGVLRSGEIIDGDGAIEPSDYVIRLNRGSYVGAIQDRTVLTNLPTAARAELCTGHRNVHINDPYASIGNPATIRNLNINTNHAAIALPAGAYNNISVNGKSRLILGTVGATDPEVYDLNRLSLNRHSRLEVVGPVLLRIRRQFNPNTIVGNSDHPEWLRIEMATSGVNINAHALVYAVVIAPARSVHINGCLEGGLYAKRIRINRNGIFRERVSIFPPNGGGNEPPVANSETFSLEEDSNLLEQLEASDPDGDNLTFSLLSEPSNGLATLSESGELSYIPNPDFLGQDTITFQVSDATEASDVATIQLEVIPVNDAPLARVEPFSVLEDTATPLILVIDDVDSTAFSLEIGNVTGGQLSGEIADLVFTPDLNYNGEATFTLTILDGDGGQVSLFESFIVGEVNDVPVPGLTAFTVDEDQTLDSFLDATDIEEELLEFALVSDAENGTVSIVADGGLIYTPAPDFNGSDSFEASVEDASGALVVFTVSLTVNPINDAPSVVDQSFGLDEDQTLNQVVVATDVENDPIIFTLSTAPSNGVVTVEADGGFVYTPNLDYNGSDQIGLIAADDQGGETSFEVFLSVEASNDIPQADASVWDVDEDRVLIGQLTGTDVDGDVLSFTIATSTVEGALSVNALGGFEYTPNPNFNGVDTFSFTVSDGFDSSEAAVVSITINPINDAPVGEEQSFELDEDSPLNGQLIATDIDGDPLAYSLSLASQNGSTLVNTDGSFLYTPNPGYAGSDAFQATVSDGIDSDSIQVELTVNEVNNAPIANNLDFQLDEDSLFSEVLVATDADADSLTYTIVSLPQNGTLRNSAGLTIQAADLPFILESVDFTYQPDLDFHGSDSFMYQAFDGRLTSEPATVRFTVLPVNDAPIASDLSLIGDEDVSISAQLVGSDVDSAVLSYGLSSAPSNGVVQIDADGTFVYTPSANYNGLDRFNYTVSDGSAISSALVEITLSAVNDAPVTSAQSFSVQEDGRLNGVLSATDIEGDVLSFSLDQDVSRGMLALSADGSFSYTPNANFNGSDDFSFSVTDGSLSSASVAVAFTVVSVNDAPVADAQNLSTDEDSALSLSLSASDIEGDALSFLITIQPRNGAISGMAPDLVYTPNSDFNGSDSFTFTASDAGASSAPQIIQIDVNPINDAPIANTDAADTDEDVAVIVDVLANDSDIEGDTLSIVSLSLETNGSAAINPDNTITWTPDADFNGEAGFSYTITDGTESTESVAVAVTVAPVNDAPVADAETVSVDEDQTLTGSLTGSDVEGDALAFALVANAGQGTVNVNADGTYQYTPNSNYNGSDSFTFEVFDGTENSAPASIQITVQAVNDAPTASDQAFTTPEDSPLTAALVVSDAEGDALTFTLISDVTNGTLDLNTDGTFTYTPSADSFGQDSFTFGVSDGFGTTAPLFAQIDVEPVNDTPVANSDSITTDEDVAVIVNVLANDTDPDGDALSIVSVNAFSNGSAVVNADQTVTFTPVSGYSGAASFTYTIQDPDGETASASVDIIVVLQNDAPVADDLNFTLSEDGALPGNLTAADPDGDAITYALDTGAANGTVSVQSDGSFLYTPNADFHGADTFTYSVTDGIETVIATVSLTIDSVNDIPVAQSFSLNTGEEQALSITLSATDADGDLLSYSVTGVPSGGSLVDSEGNPVLVDQTLSDPTLTYTPNEGFFFTDGFAYVADDGADTSDEAAVVLTVAPNPRSRTWTTSADFEAGALLGLGTETADQLQLIIDNTSLNFLWIPVSTKGTVTRIDIESARVLGEYRSAPSASSEDFSREFPSRVTFDRNGNAWVANRRSGLVVKWTTPNGIWRDKNGDTELTTSAGLNEVLDWTIPADAGAITPVERADFAEDELIVLAIETGIRNVNFIAVDPEGHLWAAGSGSDMWRQFDGESGALLREETAPIQGLGGYGGFIDPEGILYSTGDVPLRWDTRQSLNNYDQTWAETVRAGAWDIVQDSQGQFWDSQDPSNSLNRYDSDGNLLESHIHSQRWSQGLAVDFNDHLWVAHSHCSDFVSRWLPDGTFIGQLEMASHGPTDVTVDRRGFIWSTGTPGLVQRINPLGGAIGSDGETPIGEIDLQTPYLGGSIWAFGEFSGRVVSTRADAGSWTSAAFDGEIPGVVWGPVLWNADLCNDSTHIVEVAFSADGRNGWSDWEPIGQVGDLPVGTGRFIRVRASLLAADSGESPILRYLTVGTLGYAQPTPEVDWFVQTGGDIDGHWPDPIQLKGALCYTQTFEQTLSPTYLWTVVSAEDSVSFDDPTALRPNLVFGGPGDYVLKLTATDTVAGVREDTLRIHLVPFNKAPFVNAGSNQIVLQAGDALSLEGVVRDDGLPEGGSLDLGWSKKFGPGDAFFSDLSDPEATVSFTAPGIYLLQLRADDGEFESIDSLEVRVEAPCSVNITEGLVSWWQANCDAIDHISGNVGFFDGGLDFADGQVAAAFDFDGFNDRMMVFGSPSLDFATKPGMTFEAWIRPTQARNVVIFEYSDGENSGVRLTTFSDDGLRFNLIDEDLNPHAIEIDNVLPANVWRHVAVTWDREGGDVAIYINGVLRQTGNIGLIVPETRGDLYFGARQDENAYFYGLMDELTLYCVPLNPIEVRQIYNAGLFGKCPPDTNTAPLVEIDRPIYIAELPVDTLLSASVSDDGEPFLGQLSYDWSIISGPDGATLDDPQAETPSLSLTQAGLYALSLTVSDGSRSSTDTAVIRANTLCGVEIDPSAVAWFDGSSTMREVLGGTRLLSNGALYAAGLVGEEAYLFTSENSALLVPESEQFNIGTASNGWTIECWVDPRGVESSGSLLAWEGSDTSRALRIDQLLSQRLVVREGPYEAPVTIADSGGGFITRDTGWVHLAVTYERSTGELRFYRNGFVFSVHHVGDRDFVTTGNLWIGGQVFRGFYSGTLDELALYKEPLTADAVFAIFDAGGRGKCPTLGNRTPTVFAGEDRSIADLSDSVSLFGEVEDDGFPRESLNINWSQLSGSGTALFTNENSVETDVSFTSSGRYVLELQVDDGLVTVSDQLTVDVGLLCQLEVPEGVTSWFSFEHNSEDRLSENQSVEFSPVYVPGRVNTALSLLDSRSRIRVPARDGLDLGASEAGWTFEFWADSVRTSGEYLEWEGDGLNRGLVIFQRDNQIGQVLDRGALIASTQNPLFSADVGYHHIAIVYDREAGDLRFYRNAELVHREQIGEHRFNTVGDLYIGGIDTNMVGGRIDELSLFDRPLDEIEIFSIFDAGTLGKCPVDGNQVPEVSAGVDIDLDSTTDTAFLSGSVTNAGQPTSGELSIQWRQIIGTGTATFEDVNSLDTAVNFSQRGHYTLELTVNDGFASVSDRMTVRVGVDCITTVPDGIVAWFAFERDTADRITGNDADAFAPNYRLGRVGSALDMDMARDRIRVSARPDLNIGSSPTGWSFEFWVDTDSNSSSAYIIEWEGDNSGEGMAFLQRLNQSQEGGISDRGQLVASSVEELLRRDFGREHVAVVYDRAAETLIFYLNGQVRRSVVVGNRDFNTNGDLWIGGVSSRQIFNGFIDELSFYNRPLTQAELQSIVLATGTGKCANPVAAIPDPAQNVPPSIVFPAIGTHDGNTPLPLSVTITDDGRPDSNALTVQWRVLNLPQSALFAQGSEILSDLEGAPVTIEASNRLNFSEPGTYLIEVSAFDGQQVTRQVQAVEVFFAALVELTAPVDEQRFENDASIELRANASTNGQPVETVEFFVDGVSAGFGNRIEGTLSYRLDHSVASSSLSNERIEVFVEATSGEGRITRSAPVEIVLADSAAALPEVRILTPLEASILTEPTPVIGTVSSEILDSWSLEYRLIGEADFVRVSQISDTESEIDNAQLGIFDPTLLLNGAYELRLSATDLLGRTVSDTFALIVDGNTKVGNFALAFEDLTVPLAGIPIQIIRSYDSRDTRIGDFGTGWSLAINDIRLQKNGPLGADWEHLQIATTFAGFPSFNYCLEPIGRRLVSVTFPDGAQHLFEMSIDVGHGRQDIPDNCQLFAPIRQAVEVVFNPQGDTTSQLEVVGQSSVYNLGFVGITDLFTSDPITDFGAQIYDPTQFILTTADGTRYLIDEEAGLLSLEDLNGNTLEVFDDRIVSTAIDPNGGADIIREVNFLRDVEGRVTQITDPDGNTLDYGYEAGQGGLRSFTNRVDETTQFIYADARFPDYLTDIFDPRGVQAIRTEFDEAGRILRQIDAQGNPISFEHDLDNFVERTTDRLGNTTSFFYNELGNVTRQVDPDGAETLFEYFPDTDLVKYETDDLGNVTSRAYDAQENLLVEITGADASEEPLTATKGFITRYTYNQLSLPLSITDPNGYLTEFSYDARGNLLSQIQRGNNGDLTTSFTYTPGGDIASITDAEGNVTSYSYSYSPSDAAFPSAARSQTVTVTDASLGTLRVTESLFDAQENLLVERFNRELPDGSTQVVQTSFLYDEENRLIATILPDGQVAETRYNNIGQEAASIRWQSQADFQSDDLSLARVTSMTYDDRGNLIRTDLPDGTSTASTYDLEGRMLSTTNQLGETTYLVYDALGRQTQTIYPDDTMPADPAILNSSFLILNSTELADNPSNSTVYDSIGRVEFSIDALGNLSQNIYDDACACAGRLRETRAFLDPSDLSQFLSTRFTYDANGNQSTVTDPRGEVTEFIYDRFNRLVQTKLPVTVEHGATFTETEYDDLGRRIATIDQEGLRTEFSYDALGRLLEVRQPHPDSAQTAQISTSYSYDSAGNRLTETNAEGQTTRFEYDSSGRRTRRIKPEGQVEVSVYNGFGELESRTDFNGHSTTFTYDALSRLLTERADATAFPSEVGMTFTYDALGRIESMVDASGTTTLVYDERGNLLSKSNAAGTLNYSYDAANNLRSTTSGSTGGLDLQYRYDGLNRLDTVFDSGAAQPPQEHHYSYDANGNLESLTYHNGATHNWSYDSQNRLKDLTVRNAAFTTLNSYAYSLLATGHRSSVAESTGRTVGYTLDNHYRLTQEAVTGDPSLVNGTSDWTYDLIGNRLIQSSNLDQVLNVSESYNANNWLDSATYDANGNTTQSSNYDAPAEILNDTYDWRNRLVRREESDGTIIEVVYDGFGDRIRKTILNSSFSIPNSYFYLVDRNNLTGYAQVVEEKSQGDQIEVIYSYGLDLISQDRRDADGSGNFTQSYYLYDGLGSVRALADESGLVTDTYTYDAWGVEVHSTGSTVNAYRFTGEQWDEDLQMVFLRARYLNTSTGRFHTMDTFEGVTTDPVTLHKYLYANANPAFFIDPSGNVSIASLAASNAVRSILINSAIGGGINIAFVVGSGQLRGLTLLEMGQRLGVAGLSGAATGLVGGVGGKLFLRLFPRISGAIAQGVASAASGSFSAQTARELYEVFVLGQSVSFTDRFGRVVTATASGALIGRFTFNIQVIGTRTFSVLETQLRNGQIITLSRPFIEQAFIDPRGVLGATGGRVVTTALKNILNTFFDI